MVRGKVAARLGSDPFDLKPLRLVERAVEQQQRMTQQGGAQKRQVGQRQGQRLLPPCHIFSALQDDYIPAAHGRELQRVWARGAPCGLVEFSARHFGERDATLLAQEGLVAGIEEALVFDKKAEEAAALAALNMNVNSGSNAFLLLGASNNNKVPWAGVW